MTAGDSSILGHIHELVEEEKALRAAHVGEGLGETDSARMTHLQEQLDQAWDLLRQRRAHEEFQQDPEGDRERPVGEVEGYLQ